MNFQSVDLGVAKHEIVLTEPMLSTDFISETNSDRKLASVRRIAAMRPIEGADNIVCAVVDGWELVTQKSNGFQVGDLVVYFEIDSVLPEIEQFEFLRDRCWVSAERSVNGAGFRLKTIKLRGQVSQGLILPIDALFQRTINEMTFEPFWTFGGILEGTKRVGGRSVPKVCMEEGFDLTDIIGVVKYEKPLPANLAGVARGNFPSFFRKTDQERIQNCYGTLQKKWLNHHWEVTMKLDGSSFTAYYRTHPDLSEGQFGVCSRNLDLEESEGNSFWQAARKYDLESKMRKLGRSLAIQGELMGPGIQGNRENLSDLQMFVFDIFDIDAQSYLVPDDRYQLCEMMGLQHVPIEHLTMSLNGYSVSEIINLADGASLNHKIREGIVFKSRTDPNVSFKAISNKFLLKGGDD